MQFIKIFCVNGLNYKYYYFRKTNSGLKKNSNLQKVNRFLFCFSFPTK